MIKKAKSTSREGELGKGGGRLGYRGNGGGEEGVRSKTEEAAKGCV